MPSSSSYEGRGWQQLTDRVGEVERLHSIVARDAAAMKAMGVLVEAKALKLDMHGKACGVSRFVGNGRTCDSPDEALVLLFEVAPHHLRHIRQHSLIAISLSFYPCMHACIHSFLHAFPHACMHAFTRSLTPSFVPSFLPSFIPPFLHSSIPPFIHSSVHSFVHSFIHPIIYSFIHSCTLGQVCSVLSSSLYEALFWQSAYQQSYMSMWSSCVCQEGCKVTAHTCQWPTQQHKGATAVQD